MKHYIIHVQQGRAGWDGYTMITTSEKDTLQEVVDEAYEKNYFDCIEDIADVSYVKEIPKEEYESLKALRGKEGLVCENWIFAEEDIARAKKLCYENNDKQLAGEEIENGFEFMGQWITNPFVDASGRFEFSSQQDMYKYYNRDDNGEYDYLLSERAYILIMRVLGLLPAKEKEETNSDCNKNSEWFDTVPSDDELPF